MEILIICILVGYFAFKLGKGELKPKKDLDDIMNKLDDITSKY